MFYTVVCKKNLNENIYDVVLKIYMYFESACI